MAVVSGTSTTYNLNVGTKLDISDVIYQLNPYDVPLLGTYDPDGRQTTLATGKPLFERQYSWLDEEILTPRSAVATTQVTAATTLVVTAGTGARFQVGDLVRIEDEIQRVTAIATDTLTVTRAVAGTTAIQHAAAATMIVMSVGMALPEGSDTGTARALDRTLRTNYSQIFGPTAIQTSGTEDVVLKYGLTGTEHAKQVANRMKEMPIAMEQALLYGIALDDTGNFWRSFGGISSFISTHVDSSTTTLTEPTLIDQLQAVYDSGGMPDRVVVGSKQKRIISAFNSTLIKYEADGNMATPSKVRGQTVEWYDSDFGRQAIVLDRWCRTSDAFIFNRDQAQVRWMRPMQYEVLAKTGDSTKGHILAEMGFEFFRERHAAKFTALT